MFNFQGSELIIILLLALVVLGPEKLPEAMRRLGRFYADLRKMSTSFQDEFRSAVDEPMRELRDTANTIRDSTDFRKLANGDRAEKPKSAEMTDATPSSQPADAPGEVDSTPPVDPETEPALVIDTSPTPVPAPPKPFSSSQQISARAPAPAPEPAPEPEPAAPLAAPQPPPSGWPAPTAPAVPPVRQVAVDDESGLREARPLADEPAPGRDIA